jgi:glycosyltransferase involved in cell wall biosynthesis
VPSETFNRLRETAIRAGLSIAHEALLTRLRAEAWMASFGAAAAAPRVLATACWTFPIYSQTFVHQEVAAFARNGFRLVFLYSQLGLQSDLPDGCASLWRMKRRVLLHKWTGAADLARFRKRMPDKVDRLIAILTEASGLSREELEAHEHFLHAFSFARAVEAWSADYVHSYFFYERTLFAFVASHLLDLPRGVSCYADHLLQDYALKVVPVHLQTCNVVVATSHRIRAELEGLHGAALPSLIVKPNAVDTSSFLEKGRERRSDSNPLRLLSVCRIDPKKGLEYLIDAVGILVARGIPVEAHIVGAPDDHSPASLEYDRALRARVTASGLSAAVFFDGQRNAGDVRAGLERADVFVAPFVELASGDKDGIPTALLEAMAAGSVIVASDAGSIAEVIDNEREGLIVPQRHAVALADAVQRASTDAALAARLSDAAAARARRDFDIATSEIAFHDRVRATLRRRATAKAGAP